VRQKKKKVNHYYWMQSTCEFEEVPIEKIDLAITGHRRKIIYYDDFIRIVVYYSYSFSSLFLLLLLQKYYSLLLVIFPLIKTSSNSSNDANSLRSRYCYSSLFLKNYCLLNSLILYVRVDSDNIQGALVKLLCNMNLRFQ
jgi:hypothetical protein